jgi:glycine betaine/proline transport system ATP-binding protein
MHPADDYVADFVKGISNLKLINAHSIMEDINHTQLIDGIDIKDAPRVDENQSLENLIEISVSTDLPIIVTDDHGQDIGVISKNTLLMGIKGDEK